MSNDDELKARAEPPYNSGCFTSAHWFTGAILFVFGLFFGVAASASPESSGVPGLIIALIGVGLMICALLIEIVARLEALVWQSGFAVASKRWIKLNKPLVDKSKDGKKTKFWATTPAEDGTLAEDETEAKLRAAKEMLDNQDPTVRALKAQEKSKKN